MSSNYTEITLLANAKINLSLDIRGVRKADGYHLMDMINCSVDLSDEITIKRIKGEGIIIRSNAKYLPKNEKNLAYKAAIKLAQELDINLPALEIAVKKCIPSQAGLGGGSADAAAVLVGLNELLELKLTPQQLCSVGEKIGADVPYCIIGGFARVCGIGEIIEPIFCSSDFSIVILMPRRGHSTKEAFAAFDCGASFEHPNTNELVQGLLQSDTTKVAMLLNNAFSQLNKSEETARLEAVLLKNGALGASMSGSGAAVFGVFADKLSAKKCKKNIWGHDFAAYVATPTAAGVVVSKIK